VDQSNVSARLMIGERTFAPSWPFTVLAGVSIITCVALGRWQWDRGVDRRAQWAAFQAPGAALPADSRDLAALPRFQRVALTGRYDVDHQFVLDNRTRDGRAGFEILTPLELSDARRVLVNRGWIPFSGYRERMPNVRFDAGERVSVHGRLGALPSPGLPRGRVGPRADGEWPKLVSFPSLEQLAEVYGHELEPRVVLLDPDAAHGYRRDWRAPGIEPARHFSYAVQWWAFAALAVVLWITLSFKRRRE
jgi:surfeit locus 1 family protein